MFAVSAQRVTLRTGRRIPVRQRKRDQRGDPPRVTSPSRTVMMARPLLRAGRGTRSKTAPSATKEERVEDGAEVSAGTLFAYFPGSRPYPAGTRASPRSPGPSFGSVESRPDGGACNARMRPPYRCAAVCIRRSAGTKMVSFITRAPHHCRPSQIIVQHSTASLRAVATTAIRIPRREQTPAVSDRYQPLSEHAARQR